MCIIKILNEGLLEGLAFFLLCRKKKDENEKQNILMFPLFLILREIINEDPE